MIRQPTRFASLFLGIAAALAVPLAAGGAEFEWPSWRGPQRDGICQETGLFDNWPTAGPDLVWQVSGVGRGYSSISIAGGRIFTMGDLRQPEAGTYVVALDQRTGQRLWATRIGTGRPNSTPTVDANRVYALDRNGRLACLDAHDGSLIWEKDFPADFGGQMMSGWGYSESPLVDGDRLICSPGSRTAAIAALNKATGEVIWQTRVPDLGSKGRDGAGYSSIVISEGGGVRQYVQLMGRGIISVDADTGRMLWSYNRIANGTANIPTPIVRGDHVFCSTGYGTGAALLRIRPGARHVDEVYFLNSKQMQNHHGGMILVGDYVYCGHGHNQGFPLCIELATGQLRWQPQRGVGSGSAAIVYADGHLYFRYENGVVALIEANPDQYVLKGQFQMATNNGKSWPHPVIVDGKLYLRDQDDLLCYHLRND